MIAGRWRFGVVVGYLSYRSPAYDAPYWRRVSRDNSLLPAHLAA